MQLTGTYRGPRFYGPWRLGAAGVTLIGQMDIAHPNRPRSSDGTIGNLAHQVRHSDHNGDFKDGAGVRIVHAIDITADDWLEEFLERVRTQGHPAAKYLIWQRRISSAARGWAWRPYHGPNPHLKHCHISLRESSYDDPTPWPFGAEQDDNDVRLRPTENDINQAAVAGIFGDVNVADFVAYWNGLPQDDPQWANDYWPAWERGVIANLGGGTFPHRHAQPATTGEVIT